MQQSTNLPFQKFNEPSAQLLGILLPSHPDFLPILQAVREKYNIPEFSSDADGLDEILLNGLDIDWNAVRHDIKEQILAKPETAPAGMMNFYQGFKTYQDQPPDFSELDCLAPKTKDAIIQMFTMIFAQLAPAMIYLEQFYDTLTDLLVEYLMTGKTREAPSSWFGGVFMMTAPFSNEKMVLAIASQAVDPKVLAAQFKAEYSKVFGSHRPELKDSDLATAEYLSLKLSGKSLKYIVEEYELRNPDQFPSEKKAHRKAVRKHIELMKKRLQRLQNKIDEMFGDKK